ncbi:MAG: hypothetical protein R6U26_00520 [Candidatus Undinarchaeales archaeon]
MNLNVLGHAETLQFFYGQMVPTDFSGQVIFLLVYGISLFVSALVLYFALKSLKGAKSFIQDFPKALFTSFVRDLVIGPLLLITYFFPILGIVAGFIVWLGLVKYMFQVSWVKALMSWVAAGLIYLVIIIFILLPLAFVYL